MNSLSLVRWSADSQPQILWERVSWTDPFLFLSLTHLALICRVLQALTRKFILDKNVSLKALSERCPVNYTGADMYALCADAWHQAVKREVPLFSM